MPDLGTPAKTRKQTRSTTPRRRANGAAAGIPVGPTPVPPPAVSHQEIADLAYAHFLARGEQHGDDLGDWLRAETELRRQRERTGASPRKKGEKRRP